MSQLVIKRSRQFCVFTLFLGALVILAFLFVDHSKSATPSSGTLNVAGPNVTWTGTSVGGVSLDESTCDPTETTNCDTFTLTIGGNPSDWANKKAHIVISWPSAGDDYDLFVHKGSNSGPLVASSAQGGAGPEVVDLDPSNPNVGTGVFTVHVVYFTVVPPAQEYTGVASVVGGPTPTPTPPGATPTPTPTPVPALPGDARFQTYYPPTGVADDAGEPSIGVNWNTEQTHTNNRASDGAVNPAIPNGGTENYYGGFLSYMLRARFDDCSSPANVDWQQKPVTLPAAPRAAGDPILFTDHETGRTFVSQLLGLTPAGSTMEYTDDDGENFSPSEGGAPSGVDHQTIGGGPFHTPLPPTLPSPAPYPNAVYYASQSIAEASAQLSVDGGITFPLQNAMFTAAQCAGLHGHLKVAPDGTAYVPDKGCVSPGGGVPLLNGGEAAVVVSENNGVSWTVHTIPGETTTGNDDPSVGVSICRPNDPSCDKATRSNTIYLGYQADTPTGAHAKIAVSHDKGVTWEHITDVGALPGGPVINNMAFPEVTVGDPDRAAFAFFGSETPGTNSDQPEFPGVWYLYIATTYDGGAHWATINATPGDPIQRGGICGDGTCRNLLDFFDIQVDKEGRIIIGGEDGCVGGCVNGGPNSFTAKGFITRQSGGRRMFANFDPMEPALPGAPQVTGGVVMVSTPAPHSEAQLSWLEPDNGASPITQYKIYKNVSFTPIATTTERNYTDPAYVTGDAYRVTAVNAVGEGPYCPNFSLTTGPVATRCALPGLLVSNDLTQAGTDDDSGQNTPVDPRVNVKQLFVAEPFVGGGVENLVFTMQVGASTMNSAPPDSQWIILWNRQDQSASDIATYDRLYVAMVTDATGSPRFEYGKFGVPINTSPPPLPDPESNSPTKAGDADSGSYNPLTGVITITVSKSKLRAIDGGATKYVAGTDLAAANVRTYFARPDYNSDPASAVRSQRSQNNASDITADGSYSIGGNAVCAPAAELVSAVSRKTHGLGGVFDVKLAPLPNGAVGIECRRGPVAGSHEIVATFASPVTFTNISTDSGAVSASSMDNIVTINLTGVPDMTQANVTLSNVSTGGPSTTNVVIPMIALEGDTNQDARVNVGDTNETKAHSGELADDENYRSDVNTDSRINVGDTNFVKAHSGDSFPPGSKPGKAITVGKGRESNPARP